MSLRPSVIDVPLLTLNQTPGDRQGPVGRLTDAKNVVVTHYDTRSQPPMVKVQQRNGFIGMPTTCRSPVTGAATSTAWSNPELLSSLGRQLLSVCNAIPRAWNDNAFTAYDRQRVIPNRLEAEVFHTSQKTIQAEDSAWIGGVTCSVWTETTVKAQPAVDTNLPEMKLYIGFKDDNGAWVIPPRLLYDPGVTLHEDPFWTEDNRAMAKVAQDGDVFWVVYNAVDTGTELLIIQAYGTTGELLDQTQINQLAADPSDIGYWDIQAVAAGGVIVAQPVTNVTDSGVHFVTATYAGGISITSNTDATVHCTGPVAWLTNDLDSLHYLGTVAEGETETLFVYQITAQAQTHEYAYGAIPSIPDSITGWVEAGGVANQPTAFAAYAILPTVAATDGPAFDPQLRNTLVKSCDWAGTVVAVKEEHSVIPMSRAFRHDGDYYAMTYYQSGSGLATGASTEVVDYTAGDYMIGEATQSVTVSPGDFVSGSAKSLAGTFLSLRGDSVGSRAISPGSSVTITTASGLADVYGIPDGTVVAAWVLTSYAPSWKQGARLVVSASNIATANGTFDVYANVTATSTVYTSITSVAGVAILPGALTTGTYDVPLVWGYCAPALPEYVGDGSLSLLTGGEIVVTGTFAQNGTFTIIRATNGGNNYLNYGTPVSPQLPTIWVTQTTQTGFDGSQNYGMQIQAPIANLWSLDMPEAIGGTLTVSGDSVPANNGDFLITTSSGGDNVTGNETVLQPEIYTASTLPTITLTLPLDIIPFTFNLQALAPLTYAVIGATIVIAGATPTANNGAYLITAVNLDDQTFYAQPFDGRTGIVSLVFTGSETITITYPASVSPEFQPTYFMTPLEDVDTSQVGRFEAGIAYGDWRFDGDPFQISYFPLSLSTPQTTGDGVQVVLPYRAESFTSTVSTVAPTGSVIPVTASSSVSTVGIKAYTLSTGFGQAAPSGSALLLPGPLAGEFTASGFHENGVNVGPEAPFLISQDVSTSPVAQTPGTVRQYVVVFEDTDESGDRVFSIPSPALNVTLVGDATSVTIGGRLPVPLDTSGIPVPTHYGPTNRRNVGISIYATSYQGSVPTTQRYKITNDLNVNGKAPISLTNASGFAFPDEFTWEYTDENPSANILTGEVLYTDKGYLPRFPAPASRHFSTWKNRTFAAGYDGALWMSGEKTEGDATWFFPAFRFIFGNDVPLCSAPMDDYLVVLCAASVWIIPSQQLPDGTGRNGVMPTPIQLPFQNGGTGLAVALRSGVAYTSTAGGVWLITRDLKNAWLSQPIQDSLTIEPTSMTVDENQRLHIATGTSGHFVYDQVVDAWYRWALPTTTASLVAILEGQVAWEDNERVALYTPGIYADTIGEDTYGVPPDVTFSSLQFGNVRGLKACWAFIIQGTYKGPHNLNVVIGYPDENPDAEETQFGPFPMTNTGPYVVEANPLIEEASSYDVRVFADFDGVVAPANSFEFEVLSAEVGFDRSSGVNKPTKQMRAT